MLDEPVLEGPVPEDDELMRASWREARMASMRRSCRFSLESRPTDRMVNLPSNRSHSPGGSGRYSAGTPFEITAEGTRSP